MNNNEITLRYQIKEGEKKIKLFSYHFVRKNRNNFKIIYKNKEYDLSEYFYIYKDDDIKDILEIKLKIINETTNIERMFLNCSSLISLQDIDKLDTSKVKSFDSIFAGCKLLQSMPGISKWKTSNIKSWYCMFEGCSSLISLPDISKWKIPRLLSPDSFNYMFRGCSSLIIIPNIFSKHKKNLIKNSDLDGCINAINIQSFES